MRKTTAGGTRNISLGGGVPLTVIQSWLGHESQEVTRIYAQFTDDMLKMEAIERIPDL